MIKQLDTAPPFESHIQDTPQFDVVMEAHRSLPQKIKEFLLNILFQKRL